ncbi:MULTISPECIES: M1 family metallopeptidase [Flavobacterium]|uniref:Aminopeptidase N n=1 Tax=Flavobacterium jumunjinense TaxID=998845 RepID=A0ABV5GMC5_9FLAO|nr:MULTISPECIES: M1 family metallopeptidase [Flavobacterium]
MNRILLFLFISLSVYSQQTKKVDFKVCRAIVSPNHIDETITGEVVYEFEVKSKIDTIRINAIAMVFTNVLLNGNEVDFKNSGKELLLFEGYKKGKNMVSFRYTAKPKQTLYFSGEGEDLQIWTQGQGKNTSYWLPSFDDVNEKVIFNLSASFRNDFEVILNGKFLAKNYNSKGNLIQWDYSMEKPMSSYLVMMAIGRFIKQTEITKQGTVLEFYLDRKDADKFESTYRYSKRMFEFLEDEIGVKYPWGVYKQIPVRDFLYAGMENTTSTIFSQDFVVDSISFNDKNYVNVNAHELAHQWFGNLITAKESKHHWLHEGFATYYALLAEKEVFGEDYFYNELYESAQILEQASKQDTIPILSPKASSLTFYKKGAWALHALRSDIGTIKFKKAIQCYLNKYEYENVDTDEFLKIIRKASRYDIKKFKKNWLESSKFNFNTIENYLVINQSVNQLLEFNRTNRQLSEEELFEKLKKGILSNLYYNVKQEIVFQSQNLSEEHKMEIILLAMETNDTKVRQTVAEVLKVIPINFKVKFETLLNDNSYITREIALFRLWTNFKEDRESLIALSKDWIGTNYNLKIANLTLKIVGSNDNFERKQNAIAELEIYTKLPYESSVREAALQTFIELGIITDSVLEELIEASMHHKWQFVKFAKDNIRKLISNDDIRQNFIRLQSETSQKVTERINYFLKETE